MIHSSTRSFKPIRLLTNLLFNLLQACGTWRACEGSLNWLYTASQYSCKTWQYGKKKFEYTFRSVTKDLPSLLEFILHKSMLCYFWCVCDQIISRNINCLASTVTKYSHVFPSNRSQEARAMTINRIYLFDTHQKSAERQRLCRLLSFATDFVKGLVHFCQSQSHDEMSVVRCFAS